MQSATFNFVET